MRLFILITSWTIFLFVGGCRSDFFVPDQHKARYLSEAAGWEYREVQAPPFSLVAAISPLRATGMPLAVYIEGDGLAFLGPHTISSDPTPTDPVALRMALAHHGGPVVYLARPCQYSMSGPCHPAWWTSHRYAPEIVSGLNLAIDELKHLVGVERVILVGYSGGGALALLAAGGRMDVEGIVTVAANTDLADWTARHGLTPLYGSLDPGSVSSVVAAIPQVHFVGGRDNVVPPEVARSFLARTDSRGLLIQIDKFGHECCWADEWGHLASHPALATITGWQR